MISRTGDERLVVDVGLKSISGERGLPVLKDSPGLKLRRLNAEHAIMDIIDPAAAPLPGEQIEFWPHYSDATINLHKRMYGMRNGSLAETLSIDG